jgi:hypothetical protein
MSFDDRVAFRRAVRRALNQVVRDNRCSSDDHAKVLAVMRRPIRHLKSGGAEVDVVRRWRDSVAEQVTKAGLFVGSGAIPWAALVDWLVEHWPDILRLLIAILVLVI